MEEGEAQSEAGSLAEGGRREEEGAGFRREGGAPDGNGGEGIAAVAGDGGVDGDSIADGGVEGAFGGDELAFLTKAEVGDGGVEGDGVGREGGVVGEGRLEFDFDEGWLLRPVTSSDVVDDERAGGAEGEDAGVGEGVAGEGVGGTVDDEVVGVADRERIARADAEFCRGCDGFVGGFDDVAGDVVGGAVEEYFDGKALARGAVLNPDPVGGVGEPDGVVEFEGDLRPGAELVAGAVIFFDGERGGGKGGGPIGEDGSVEIDGARLQGESVGLPGNDGTEGFPETLGLAEPGEIGVEVGLDGDG